jgi:hypothetical protein
MGLVYLPFVASLDFWLVDFATKASRQLTRLANTVALAQKMADAFAEQK